MDVDYFALLDQAIEERTRDQLGCADDEPVEQEDDSVMVHLQNGGFHMCSPRTCPYIIIEGSDKSVVCALCGISWGSEIVGEHDAQWTGRSTTSGDPDAVAGTPIGGWKPRKDAFAESQRAFEIANTISGEQAAWTDTKRDKNCNVAKQQIKRGALCVDEVRDEPIKRQRITRKSSESRETTEKLRLEAIAVCDKLTTPIESTGGSSQSTGSNPKPLETQPVVVAQQPQVDIRLQNVEFVTTLALRKYLNAAKTGNERFDMSRVHDIIVAANEFVRNQRRLAKQAQDAAAQASTTKQRRRQYDGETKTYCVSLALALWKAVSCTPNVAGRGSDSFRSFVSGVLYSLKRGLTLDRLSLEIIPSIPELSEQLPTLRSADASLCARQLQSSSHRGLCALHRAISSFNGLTENDENFIVCRDAWANAASVSSQLYKFVATRSARGRL